jgi:hypothetical protein
VRNRLSTALPRLPEPSPLVEYRLLVAQANPIPTRRSNEAAGRFVCAFPSVFLETARVFHTSALALIDPGTI